MRDWALLISLPVSLTVLILKNQTWLIIRLLKEILKSSCLDYLQSLPTLVGQPLAEWDIFKVHLHMQAWYLLSMTVTFGKCFLGTLSLFSLVQRINYLIEGPKDLCSILQHIYDHPNVFNTGMWTCFVDSSWVTWNRYNSSAIDPSSHKGPVHLKGAVITFNIKMFVLQLSNYINTAKYVCSTMWLLWSWKCLLLSVIVSVLLSTSYSLDIYPKYISFSRNELLVMTWADMIHVP